MNIRQNELRLTVELRQVTDAVECIFHSLLLHRTLGRFQYNDEKTFSMGSIGIKEVSCEQIDMTYVRVNSTELAMCVDEDIRQFKCEVEEATCSGSIPRRTPTVGSPTDSAIPLLSAQIGLQFYTKSKKPNSVIGTAVTWFGGAAATATGATVADDGTSWEEWKLILDVFRVESIDELQKMRQRVADDIGEKVLDICEHINHNHYTPKMPTKTEIPEIFETKFSDCQPYLFKIRRQAVPQMEHKQSLAQVALSRWKDILAV
ncbi:Autophagy-related protein 101 [Caenorhabditis elegans]|uniref:Autophagy-related protein 101 n=3 Tax=Caenorhabditis elegans TaxID=6239 RepID=Q95XH2_CAEEL|nr:Autophagy-related protein 101 [Caenorhabditis elegans]CCD74140.1 Autophagy-related protein 101 [Caenorhabditis elegans]|eukprot:NP_741338.2 Ectopic P Granules [Caenorhabditis elegans]